MPFNQSDKHIPWHSHPKLWEKVKVMAQDHRASPTAAENVLWQHLRRRQLGGHKFRRQHVIDRFIVDFYCHEIGLVIEVDGPIHEYSAEEDAMRQQIVEDLGFRFLRFSNDDVLQHTTDVLSTIAEALENTNSK